MAVPNKTELKSSEVGMSCIKILLCFSSMIFTMTGFLLISTGITINTVYSLFSVFICDYMLSPSSMLATIGLILVLISSLGIIGALKESTCTVMTYAASLSVLLFLELFVAIWTFSTDDFSKLIDNNLQNAMTQYVKNPQNDYVVDSIDYLQSTLKCCGNKGIMDWQDLNYTNEVNLPFPDSCCGLFNGTRCANVYATPCLDNLVALVYEGEMVIGTSALTFGFLQILGILFAINLAKGIRQAKTRREVEKWLKNHPESEIDFRA